MFSGSSQFPGLSKDVDVEQAELTGASMALLSRASCSVDRRSHESPTQLSNASDPSSSFGGAAGTDLGQLEMVLNNIMPFSSWLFALSAAGARQAHEQTSLN